MHLVHAVKNRIMRIMHNPRSHYTVIACIGLILMHEGGKTADYLFLLLSLMAEDN